MALQLFHTALNDCTCFYQKLQLSQPITHLLSSATAFQYYSLEYDKNNILKS